MNWNFTIKADSKALAKDAVSKHPDVTGGLVPVAFVSAILQAIDMLPEPKPDVPEDGTPFSVKVLGNQVQVASAGNLDDTEQRLIHGAVSVNIVPKGIKVG